MSMVDKILQIKEDYDNVYDKGDIDSFWDIFQQNGERTDYTRAFQGNGWTNELFDPKYPILVEGCYGMFYNARNLTFDLRDYDIIFKIQNGQFNTGAYTFYLCNLTGLPVLDFSEATSGVTFVLFINSSTIKEIDGIILNDNCTFSSSGWIAGANITKIIFSGSIGNTLTVSLQKLNKASLISLVNTLSSNVSEKSVTLSKTAINNAFETSPGLADGSTSQEWQALMNTKQNWTFAY